MKVTITNNCNDYEFEVHAAGCRDLAKTEARAIFGHTWTLEVQRDPVKEVMADVNDDLEACGQSTWDRETFKFHACTKGPNYWE